MNAYTNLVCYSFLNNEIATKTTQVTAHRGNQRLWLQNAPEMLADCIVLRLAIASECKVRKVSATARGATLDINNNKLKAYDFSNGIKWSFLDGQINIAPIARA
jgi:hypothetical protein